MVENFTQVDENVENIELEFLDNIDFEEGIKQNIKTLAKSPSQETLDKILNYSKTLNKN